MFSRYALCTAVHAEAARRLVADEELALAIGVAFATYYAILKNARLNGKKGANGGVKLRYHDPQPFDPMRETLQTYKLGKIEIKVCPERKMAWVKLGNSWIGGKAYKGKNEIAKLPPELIERIKKEFPEHAINSERYVFDFYKKLRDEIRL